MKDKQALVDLFKLKAEAVSAVVVPVGSMKQAYEYVVDICEKKEACQILASGCEEGLSPTAQESCATKKDKVIAAPGLAKKLFKDLEAASKGKGFTLIQEGMREHLGGIDIGFTVADHGIAETGTLVLGSRSEELRLATMVCEIHVAVLPLSKLVETSFELEDFPRASFAKAPDYTAFITGASRTADIERVLALGVHGPLELHILLWEDK